MKKFFNTLGIIFLILFVFEFFVSQWLGDNKWASVIGGHKFTYHMHLLSIDEDMTDSPKTDLTVFDPGTAVTSEEKLINLDNPVTAEITHQEMKDESPETIVGWFTSIKGWEQTIKDKERIEKHPDSKPEEIKEAIAQREKNENQLERVQNIKNWISGKNCNCPFASAVADTLSVNVSLSAASSVGRDSLKKAIIKYQHK